MSDEAKAPCLVCDAEGETEDGSFSFCPTHMRQAAQIAERSHPLKVLLLSAMELGPSVSDAATMINRLIGPTILSHERCLELDAMTEQERAYSLSAEYGMDALRLALTLYRHERGSWIPADYMSV